MSATAALGTRISRAAAIYGGGLMLTVLLGLVNVVVMTRFFPPSEFGELATLLFFAEFSAVIYNLGSMHGGLAIAFGGAIDDAADFADEEPRAAQDRSALGTTLLLTAAIGLAGAAAVALVAETIGDLLLGDPGAGDLVMLASAIALFTAVWRVLAVVPQRERRPLMFVLLNNARPALMTLGAVPFLVAGHGVEGALLGALVGSAAAAGLAMALTAANSRPRLRWPHVARIFVTGAAFVPAVLALWLLRNAEVYLLAQLASVREVGIFRVASRAGALMSFPVSAILLAWGAISRDPLHRAVERDRGGIVSVGGLVATYFAFATLWIELGIAIGADVLVAIAPSEYDSAAPLIPLVALGLLLHGWFLVVYRLARLRRRMLTYNLIVLGELAAFLVLCVVLIPPHGATGAGIALAAAPAGAAATTFVLAQRAPTPVAFEYRRIAAAIGIAVLLYGVERLVAPALGDARPVLAALLLLAYPVVLIALGVISQRERHQLLDVVRDLVPRRSREHPVLDRFARLPRADRTTLEGLVMGGRSLTEVAADAGMDVATVRRQFLHGLRQAAALDIGERPGDDQLATHLLMTGSDGNREGMTATLWAKGVDPLEADTLSRTLGVLRRGMQRRRIA